MRAGRGPPPHKRRSARPAASRDDAFRTHTALVHLRQAAGSAHRRAQRSRPQRLRPLRAALASATPRQRILNVTVTSAVTSWVPGSIGVESFADAATAWNTGVGLPPPCSVTDE